MPMLQQNLPTTTYKPSELLEMFKAYLSRQSVNVKVIFLRGIYVENLNNKPYWPTRYDILKDENTSTEITLKMPQELHKSLKNGNLVIVGGVLERQLQNNSRIQLMLEVSRVKVEQEQAIDENEIKRMELRRKKSAIGFRNVDALLEQLLYTDQRPKIALLFADTSITMTDFEQGGGNIAKVAFDFTTFRANFSRTIELVNTIKGIDAQSYTAIAIVRGGGSGIEALDKLDILETIANLNTPFISAIGHPDEKLFIKELADREVSVPNDLGHYFKDMMETVNEKKTKSRAALTEQIKKQFKEQLEAGQKQNKELNEKLAKLTKTQEDSNKKHLEQVQAMTKAYSEATKKHNEQIEVIQKQHKEQIEKANIQNKDLQKRLTEFNDSLKKMQETNSELNKSLEKLTTQNTQTAKNLQEAKDKARDLEKQLEEALKKNKGCLGMVATIMAVASVACWIICLIV